MSAHPLPRIAVVYDIGSAGPGEIARGLTRVAEPVFAVYRSDFTTRLLPVIEDLGDVVAVGADDAAAERALRRCDPDAILTFSEHLIPYVARIAARLGLPYQDPSAAAKLTDKFLQREALRAAGVDSVRIQRLTEPGQWQAAVACIGLPAVIKPARGVGSRNTFRIDDIAAGARLTRALLSPPQAEPELVAEEFLAGRPCEPYGDYVSVESMAARGEIAHLAVTGKFPLAPPFREVGHFWPPALDAGERSAVEDLATAALRALGAATGLFHTEVKLTPQGPRIIEVNGRMGGLVNVLAEHAAGVDLIEQAGRLALGEPVPSWRPPPDRVTFLHHNPVPVLACRYESVTGVTQVRGLPGVRSYHPVLRPGAAIDGGVRTQWLDLLVGEAADHAQMLAVVDAALDLLTFTFSVPGGSTQVSARRLRDFGKAEGVGDR